MADDFSRPGETGEVTKEYLVDLGPDFKDIDVEYEGDEMILNMGPQHPSTHGVLRLELTLDGELVTKAVPHIGYLHRCFEKHAESVPYNEVIPYTDRMDYVAAINQNWSFVLAVEKMLEAQIPERVEFMRVIMAELTRITSHLLAIGTFGLDVGAFTPFLWVFRDREKILDLIEKVTGARLLPNYIWVGGVSRDFPPGLLDEIIDFLDYFAPKIGELNRLFTYNWIMIERTNRIGILPVDTALAYGVTGPNLRGSGCKFDLRRDEPYSVYDKFDFEVVVGTGENGPVGSAWDRYFVRVREIEESIKIIRQAVAQMPSEGGIHDGVPRRLRPPAGAERYARTETPRGEQGMYVISDGSNVPMRVKARSPSFCNLSVLEAIIENCLVADVVAVLGSLDIVLGCIDR